MTTPCFDPPVLYPYSIVYSYMQKILVHASDLVTLKTHNFLFYAYGYSIKLKVALILVTIENLLIKFQSHWSTTSYVHLFKGTTWNVYIYVST